jgi:hypothetical protein
MIAARRGPGITWFQWGTETPVSHVCTLPPLYRYQFTHMLCSYELLFSMKYKDQSQASPRSSPQLRSSSSLPSSAQRGIFTLGETPVDPLSFGFTKHTVHLMSACSRHLSSSDVFVDSQDHALHSRSALESLSDLLAELNHPSPSLDDHVFQAFLLATTIKYPTLSPSSHTSLPRKIKQLGQHLIQTTPMHSFWKPLPECYCGVSLVCLLPRVCRKDNG